MIKFALNIFNKHQAIRYLFAGGLNTVISLLLYYGLLKLHVNYLVATSIANVFGVIEGFLLNAILVFKHKVKLSGLIKYSSVYGISFVNNLAIMYVFVELLYVSKWLAPIPTTIICTLLNYWMVKRFVFSKRNVDV